MITDGLKKYGVWIDPVTPIQKRFMLDNEHRFFVVPAGRRSRKSLISSWKLRNWAMEKPGRYFHGAPTRDQAKKIFWKPLLNAVKLLGVYKQSNETELSVIIDAVGGTSEIVVAGLDKPERIEGQPWDGCHLTEFPSMKPYVWAENVRPVLSDTNGFGILDGVPDYREKNFANHYKLAEMACGGNIPKTLPGQGAYASNGEWAYYSWFSEDVLSEKEMQSVKKELDERIYRQEYCGDFIQAGGSVYYMFTDENIMNIEFNPNADTWISYDFGVGQGYMSAVIIQKYENKILCIKEYFIQGSNTAEVTQTIVKYLKEQGFNGRLGVTGDFSGNTTQSTSSVSDYMIIEQILNRDFINNFSQYRQGFGTKVTPTTTVKDRVNITNACFRNANNESKLYIDGNCKYLIEDLRRVVWSQDNAGSSVMKLDKTDPKRTHMSDSLTYYCYNNEQTIIKAV